MIQNIKINPRAGATATRVDCGKELNKLDSDSTPRHAIHTTPEACPRFAKCVANICPLDVDWPRRKHLRGEPICLYLREAVKVGGLAVLHVHIPGELSKRVVRALPEIVDRYVDISRRLIRASTTPSKIVNPRHRQLIGVA